MKTYRSLNPFALLLLALALAFGPALRAEETTPPPAAPPPAATPAIVPPDEAAPAPADQSATAAAKPAEPAAVATPVAPPAEAPPAPAAPLEQKAAAAIQQPESKSQEPADVVVEKAQEKTTPIEQKVRKHRKSGIVVDEPSSGDRIRVMDDNHVPAGLVVKGNAVAVMGDLTVDGEVMHDAVAVMGDNTINGTVHGNAVNVMGDLILGPKAHVEGNLVSVGGEVHRDPAAVVGGEVRVEAMPGHLNFGALNNWWSKTLRLGRPLAIGAHLGWLWIVTGFTVAVYALLALLFPGTIRRCGDKVVQEPGFTLLAAVLGLLALPVLFLLLCITIIGIPVALLLLPVAVVLAVLFGKAGIYALVGRMLTGDRLHPALATILGALVFVLLYLFPFVGLLLSLLVAFIGFGSVILVLFASKPKPAPVAVAAAVAPPPFAPAAAGIAAAAAPTPVVAEAPAVGAPPPLPPVISAATLPRAGFWIRVGAAFLDFILITLPLGIIGAMDRGPGIWFIGLVAYHVVMWTMKGTTIGGVICGLKVVRLDDRPIDWAVALVRALTAFLSMMPGFLGFIWVAFDDNKQSWHDKVAGTTIVRVPKGTSLI